MNERHISKIAKELSIKDFQVIATAKLLEEDSTVPFIARYRKEATGSLDEVIWALFQAEVRQPARHLRPAVRWQRCR